MRCAIVWIDHPIDAIGSDGIPRGAGVGSSGFAWRWRSRTGFIPLTALYGYTRYRLLLL